MKKLLTLICACLFSAQVFAAAEPIPFLQDLTDDIISNVLTGDKTEQERLDNFKIAFQKALDLKAIGQFVLGRFWKAADKADQQQFLTVFMDFVSETWAKQFSAYTGQKINFTSVRSAEGNQLYVDSVIDGKSPTEVVWRLRQKGDEFKIIDIIVEGVSMAMSYRNEYATFLQQNGGNLKTLIKELQSKIKSMNQPV